MLFKIFIHVRNFPSPGYLLPKTQGRAPAVLNHPPIVQRLIPGLTNVTVRDGGTYNPATGAIYFPAMATLASGTNQSRTISFVPPPTLTSISNIVSSRADTPDPELTNNKGSIVAGPGQAGGRVTTSIDAVGADLVTSKSGLTSAPASSSVTYSSGSRSTTFDLEPSNNNGFEPRATVTTALMAQSTPKQLLSANSSNPALAPNSAVKISRLGGRDSDGTVVTETMGIKPCPSRPAFLDSALVDDGCVLIRTGGKSC